MNNLNRLGHELTLEPSIMKPSRSVLVFLSYIIGAKKVFQQTSRIHLNNIIFSENSIMLKHSSNFIANLSKLHVSITQSMEVLILDSDNWPLV